MEEERPFDLAGQIIGLAMKVHSSLGPGFLESVYKTALAIELGRTGHRAEREKSIVVYYDGKVAGSFLADILVGETLIVEVKAVAALAKAHEVQLVNYLVATKLDHGLILNFGSPQLEFKKKFRLPKTENVSF